MLVELNENQYTFPYPLGFILSFVEVPLAPEELEAILGDGVLNEDGEDLAWTADETDDAERTAL